MMLESALTIAAASSIAVGLALAKRASERRFRRLIERLGREQGLVAAEGVEQGGIRFDLAWREGNGRLTHVFILDGVKPPAALIALKRACELWGVKGFYVASEKRAKEAARLLKDGFSEANGRVWVLTKRDVKELATLKFKYGKILDELRTAAAPPTSPTAAPALDRLSARVQVGHAPAAAS